MLAATDNTHTIRGLSKILRVAGASYDIWFPLYCQALLIIFQEVKHGAERSKKKGRSYGAADDLKGTENSVGGAVME